jgi:hypothetical protein
MVFSDRLNNLVTTIDHIAHSLPNPGRILMSMSIISVSSVRFPLPRVNHGVAATVRVQISRARKRRVLCHPDFKPPGRHSRLQAQLDLEHPDVPVRIAPLRTRCISSMPAIVIAAVAKPLKPSIIVDQHGKLALAHSRCRSSPRYVTHRRAQSRSRFARPYICRLIILSFVMWPSVCPLDQGSTIAAATAR